ncbi:MAG: PQQ-binding-like beta-propeller repeat protein [Prolixibacteraceae bacterium]|jgi:outer membrane protein assembly factor BamB|nr:PQQ-binding-like beta-propeller repeat protein [Prolixibacteraceae bacterium]
MKQVAFLFLIISLSVAAIAENNNANKWRGPMANGIYDQPGLMESWPDDGPETLWVYEGLGNGFSSPVIANGKIYVSGEIDNQGYIFYLNLDGNFIKKHKYGEEFTRSYPGSRATPTIVGDLVYMHTGEGKIYCLKESTGEQVWMKNLFTDFDGNNLRFGMTESLVVEDDVVYVTPGGEKHSIVALNRFNGDSIWTVSAGSGPSAYCTPLLFEYNNENMLVTVMGDKIIGVEREKGELKWTHDYRNQRSIHPNTPIYHDGGLFCFSGYGHGGVKLEIANNNKSVEQKYWSDHIESKMGGAVLLNGVLYSSGDKNRGWYAVEWKTGELLYQSENLANGVVIAANGLLYKYTDRGELALVKPTSTGFEIISQTKVEHGTAQHWAHPVIKNSILYVRHGDALIAYNIKE